MTTEYIKDLANKALPFLVYHAQLREIVTYGKIAKYLNKHHRVVPHLLGVIRDEICIKRGLPLLNAIVINQSTQMPGESFLPEGTSHLSKEEYRKKYEEFRDEVFKCDKWDILLEELKLVGIQKKPEDLDQEGNEYTNMIARKRVGYGESNAHLQLKKYISSNPEELGLSKNIKSQIEYPYISGDRCDVIFELKKNKFAVVEVKIGERGELIRGIYQAIKYRSLMIAEKGHGTKIPVGAFLVAYTIPRDIVEYAKRFLIQCIIINKKKMAKLS